MRDFTAPFEAAVSPTLNTVHIDPMRFGMIVPSSNVTMERELPTMLANRHECASGKFSFHASRVRMKSVTPEELSKMNKQAARSAGELADAAVDVVAYACLVAVMAEGRGAHRQAEADIGKALQENGCDAPVVTSAGALVDTLKDINVTRTAVIAPYAPALTAKVCDYIVNEGVELADVRSLNVTDNTAVGKLNPYNLIEIAAEMPSDIDALVLSACVQMPSLPALQIVEDMLGIPVITAASATMFQCLKRVDRPTRIEGAGRLLSGVYDTLNIHQEIIQ